ncbi:MAG: hypothetical protein ACRDEA_13090 [Microcystaceae cyanobacterium]
MLAKIRVKQWQRKALMVLLSLLVAILSASVTSVRFLPESSHTSQALALNKSRIDRASDELVVNLHQSRDRLASRVKHLIEDESNQAAIQFKKTIPATEQPAKGLGDAIRITLVEQIINSLRATVLVD